MKENGYYVYIHKNIINKKVYIGITSQEPNQRWRNGTNYYGNEYFNRAIKKYGWDKGFEHIILFEGLTKNEAERREIELIAFYDSTNKDKGYNIENGGNSTGKHSEETKRKISESQKGKLNHMYGQTGEKNSRSKKVICLTDGKIYASAYEAGKSVGIKSVDSCCRGEKKSAGVNDFGERLLWMYYEEYLSFSKEEINNKIKHLKDNLKPKKSSKDNTYSNNSHSKKNKMFNRWENI